MVGHFDFNREFDVHVTMHWDKFLIKKNQLDAQISQIYSWNETLHVSDSSSVHQQEFFTVHTAMLYVIQVCWQLASRIRILILYIFTYLYKFVHLVGFIIRNLTDKLSTLSFLSQISNLQAVIMAGDIHPHLYTWIIIRLYSNGMTEWEWVKWVRLAQTSSHEQGLVNCLC
jgi:hypothetical protein